jgi:hypothetical protein
MVNMPELKDWINSINKTKEDLLSDDDAGLVEKDYNPFVINRCLSYFPELIYIVNEANQRPDADKKFLYHLLLHTIEARNRFSPWQKQEKSNDLDLIKKYYGYSNQKAKEVLRILSPEQITYIKMKLDHGTVMTVEKVKMKTTRKRK